MVKVLIFQLFSSQVVCNSELEPIDMVVISQDSFLVATKEGSIQAYSSGEEHVLIHQFLSVSLSIKKIHYIPNLDCVLSLEKKNEKSDSIVVRAYFNWRVGVTGATLKPLLFEEEIDKFDESGLPKDAYRGKERSISVFRFPHIHNATAISSCPETGNVVIASGNIVTIYVQSVKKFGDSFVENPFVPLIEIDTAWQPTMVSLAKDYVCFASSLELQVLKLDVVKYPTDKRQQYYQLLGAPLASIIGELNEIKVDPEDDTYFIETKFDERTGETKQSQSNITLNLPSISNNAKRNKDSDDAEFELRGQKVLSDHGARIVKSTRDSDEDSGSFSSNLAGITENLIGQQYYLKKVTLILHKRFASSRPLHTISFQKEYNWEAQTQERSWQLPSSKISIESPLIGNSTSQFSLFISETRTGFLLDLTTIQTISQYTYTNESFSIFLTPSLLYAVTNSGLEVWTIRNTYTEKIRKEVNLQDMDFPEASLIGFQQFISLKAIVATDNFVVILSKHTYGDSLKMQGSKKIPITSVFKIGSPGFESTSFNKSPSKRHSRTLSLTTLASYVGGEEEIPKEKEENFSIPLSNDQIMGSANWSLYVLTPVPVSYLYEEMIKKAKDSVGSTKFLLLLEGYLLLQIKLLTLENHLQTVQLNGNDQVTSISLNLLIKNLTKLLKYASGILGDYFMDCKLYEQAAKFYVGSDRRVTEVIQKFAVVNDSSIGVQKDRRVNGILTFLDRILFSSDSSFEDSPDLSNMILSDIYAIYAKDHLSDVIMDSKLREYDQQLAVSILEGFRKQKIVEQVIISGSPQPAVGLYVHPKESFALSLLYLDLGKVDMARKMILEIESEDLVKLCLNYSHLLQNEVVEYKELELEPEPELSQDETQQTTRTEESIAFGQLLRTCVPSIFLEVAIRLRYTDFPLLSILDTIKYIHPNQKDNVSREDLMDDKTLLRLFLESVLFSNDSKDVRQNPSLSNRLVSELFQVYLTSMIPTQSNEKSSSIKRGSFSLQVIQTRDIPSLNFRYPWLDKIEPFIQESLSVQDVNSKWPMILRKIQNLLCSPYPRDSKTLLQKLEQASCQCENKKVYGQSSIEILLLPKAGNILGGIRTLLNERPTSNVLVEYAKVACEKPEDWQIYLATILEVREKAGKEDKDRDLRRACRESHSSILEFLSFKIDPSTLMKCLPEQGSLAYFLPFIETSLQRFSSQNTKLQ